MSFASPEFIFIFLPITILVFHFLKYFSKRSLAIDFLILASLFFYSFNSLDNLPILICSLLFNYFIAKKISKFNLNLDVGLKKALFIMGISINIIFLSYYKYFDVLPLGISFFTLIQIMYLVDSYQGTVQANNFREHSIFVAFFPTLTMGPLIRAKSFIPQINSFLSSELKLIRIEQGILLFCLGLFKKVVISYGFARIANAGFSSENQLSFVEAFLASSAFTFQLYFDFSGYSDMAIGIAILLGFAIPINFRSPYLATSIIDFWARWHITLSNFITHYLFTPIIKTFSKVTIREAVLASLISMIIAGIWHGAGINFIIFGLIHGICLGINRVWKSYKIKMPSLLGWFLTFIVVNVSFVFFRANDFSQAIEILSSLLFFGGIADTSSLEIYIRKPELLPIIFSILCGLSIVFLKINSNDFADNASRDFRTIFICVVLFSISIIYLNSSIGGGFIYNDF